MHFHNGHSSVDLRMSALAAAFAASSRDSPFRMQVRLM